MPPRRPWVGSSPPSLTPPPHLPLALLTRAASPRSDPGPRTHTGQPLPPVFPRSHSGETAASIIKIAFTFSLLTGPGLFCYSHRNPKGHPIPNSWLRLVLPLFSFLLDISLGISAFTKVYILWDGQEGLEVR